MPMTITEALAEIKTVGKRIEKKREFIQQYLHRQEGLKDPLDRDGGSVEAIRRERQAVLDLEERIIVLRRGIQHANDTTEVTVNGKTRKIAEWIIWRRDVAATQTLFFRHLQSRLNQLRETARRSGSAIVSATVVQENKPTDYVVNVDEGALAREAEQLEEMLGQLDGQLSLKNATVLIEE